MSQQIAKLFIDMAHIELNANILTVNFILIKDLLALINVNYVVKY